MTADHAIAACRQTHALLAADLPLTAAASERCAPLLSIKEMLQKTFLLVAVLFAVTAAPLAVAADTPGVTATEIKIGNTSPYSGPASAASVIAKLETAFFRMVNDQGGVAGRKINFISLDDGYSPPKTVKQVRRLIEENQVVLLFNTVLQHFGQHRHSDKTGGTGERHLYDYRRLP
jgi:ABC-type branched-subunit amino acid transport system substrate-binding protein